MAKVLVLFLKALRAMFGSDNFTRAIMLFVESRQERKNTEHDERAAVREEHAEGDLVKEKDRTDKLKHKAEDKEERRDLKEEHGPFPKIKEQHKKKKAKRRTTKESRKNNR